jgi:hypothetical protein
MTSATVATIAETLNRLQLTVQSATGATEQSSVSNTSSAYDISIYYCPYALNSHI